MYGEWPGPIAAERQDLPERLAAGRSQSTKW